MNILTAVPYIMGLAAIMSIFIGCYWKQIMEYLGKEGTTSTQFVWCIAALVLLPAALSLNYEIGYRDSFPVMGAGQTATVLAIYHPDFRHDQQKIPQEKRCLVRLKDDRETIVKESEFYHKEMDDIVVGDVIIKEYEGFVYILRNINIHRTIPSSIYRRNQSENPIIEEFTTDNRSSEDKKPELLP